MSLSQSLVTEFDAEMSSTRRALERIPDDRLGWQPHEKSMSLSRLGSHLAELPAMGARILGSDHLDMAARMKDFKPTMLGSRAEILELFDTNVRTTRTALESADDAALAEAWALRRGSETVRALTRATALRAMLLSHLIHHRGQLTVYLRLVDAAVPSIYGPSADESM